MIRTVHLRGPFSRFVDGPVRVEASSVRDLIEALTRQIKGFQPTIRNGRKSISVLGYDLFEDLFRDLNDDEREFHVFPTLFGAKSGGIFQVLIGAVLVAVSPLLGPLAGFALSFGVSMVLGGLTQLLFPAPQVDGDNDAVEQSKYLAATGNTTEWGTRIPIVYGQMKVGGHYLSFDVDAADRGI